ncbi:MAG: AAA family ATPase, partial [Phycisphaerae bacterium]
MNLSIPIYVEEHKVPGSPQSRFVLRPAFATEPSESGPQLSSAVSKLARKLRDLLDKLAHAPLQGDLIPWTFAPTLAEHALKFTVHLRRHTVDCKCLVLTFDALDRRLAVIPGVEDLWFEIQRGQTVEARTREVIEHHLRAREKDLPESSEPTRLTSYTRAWVTQLELDVHPNPKPPKADARGLMALFGGGVGSGRAELQKVGRCLDWLFPDDLDRVVLREPEVEEVRRLLAEPDRRPVLLVGPRKVGKTAIVHETVWRRVDERKQPHVAERNVWLLAPQRLISGMSYVGQWEERLLAILTEARERHHVLYFDDVLGLYQAGISADSDLNVAAVMRPWVERREFRMLAEMTPEEFRVFQERDRGLADQFHVLPVREPGEAQARRVLIHVGRQLENRHKCRFDVEVLPAVIDLQSRYVRDRAMPGKAAGLLAQLALKHSDKDVTRDHAIGEFQATSGLSVAFLDNEKRLARTGVIDALAKQIIGQRAALEALADVVTVAKARLNDPGRPLGTLLFLGPTGVGKTQCAKALAAYLYGDEDRLLRFDMNEYVESDAITRLVGTFAQPEGLLTGAVRRQPFCVVLLDEIEKAHPAVFDLLLQVLGEGRLTDAVGRTSDFTNAIVIMTSNLGTGSAGARFGLRPASEAPGAHDAAYVDAARGFFRPEFFNRIDRIVPFAELTREHVAQIANHLIAGLLAREGLVHRRCVLSVEPAAMARIVDQGYHPQLGARALRRAVERQLTRPIAERLAAVRPDAPTIVTVYPGVDGGVLTDIRALLPAAPTAGGLMAVCADDADAVLGRVEAYLDGLEARLAADEAARGGPGRRLSAAELSAAHFRYFAIREQVRRVDQMIGSIDQEQARAGSTPRNVIRGHGRGPRPVRRVRCVAPADAARLGALLTAVDAPARLSAVLDRAQAVETGIGDRVADLLQEVALLRAMEAGAVDPAAGDRPVDRVLVEIRRIGGGRHHPAVDALRDAYLGMFAQRHGYSGTGLALFGA